MKEYKSICPEIIELTNIWEPRLKSLTSDILNNRRNSQNRTIKQILGHMIDSASNNIHRTVHLQYQKSPLQFPNYATYGNNDRWIAIQNYQGADWDNLVQFWKYSNLHFVHVVNNIDESKLNNVWEADKDKYYSLQDIIIDYLSHFKLHLGEIEELINKK